VISALYVEKNGTYFGLEGVDPWDEERDARLYDGPWPVVAHPPCARWSRLAGFTEARFGLRRGEDGGCFKAALEAVHTYGGVLEHPAYSDAWKAFGLPKPVERYGWTLSFDGGASCYVEQGRYGLPVKKATWLYAYGVDLADLRWGYTADADGDPENQTEHGGMDAWRDRFKGRREQWQKGSHRGGRHGLTATTPPIFRDALLDMARTAHTRSDAGQAKEGCCDEWPECTHVLAWVESHPLAPSATGGDDASPSTSAGKLTDGERRSD
jgi:hypothetical protein